VSTRYLLRNPLSTRIVQLRGGSLRGSPIRRFGHRIAVTQNGHGDALAPADVPLRAGDAIHTATALETGETEIWTNDRHLLAAVAHFGLAGRSA
jgi:hypothetical protein